MISVIIPVYNRQKELYRALQALADQTMKNFEVLVCDDGSRVDLEPTVNSFKSKIDIHYFRLKHSGGPAQPRIFGIKHAAYEWISFLDADDWWFPERIEVISDQLRSDVDLIYHPLKIVRSRRYVGWTTHVGRSLVGDPLADMLSRGNPIPNSSAVVRKALLNDIKRPSNNKALVSFEDFDTWITLAKIGAHFLFIKCPLGYYWIGSDNISNISERQIHCQRYLFDQHCKNLSEELTGWAKSYNSYVIGTYQLYLRKPKNALATLREANRLRFLSQRFKRFFKMVVAAGMLVFSKQH
jgi:glycosyltransferase involved in cell wall biosynthesis